MVSETMIFTNDKGIMFPNKSVDFGIMANSVIFLISKRFNTIKKPTIYLNKTNIITFLVNSPQHALNMWT